MVASSASISDDAALLPPSSTPFLATAPMAECLLFPIPRWRFRTGCGASYEAWWLAVRRLLQAFGVNPEDLHQQCPAITIPSFAVTGSFDVEGVAEAFIEHRTTELNGIDRWQRINTAIYWHVEPSLEFHGVHAQDDRRQADSYIRGRLAHGRALILMALHHTTDSLSAYVPFTPGLGSLATLDAKSNTTDSFKSRVAAARSTHRSGSELFDGKTVRAMARNTLSAARQGVGNVNGSHQTTSPTEADAVVREYLNMARSLQGVMNRSNSNISGRKRTTASAEADAVSSLIEMSNTPQRALQAALDSMLNEESELALGEKIVALAGHLGTARPQHGTVCAIKAVLSNMLWPSKFDCINDLWRAFNTTRDPYYKYARQVARLRDTTHQRTLQAALNSVRTGQTGVELEEKIVALAHQLGTMQPKIGTISALQAVLAKEIWPNKYANNAEHIAAYKASPKCFYHYAARLKQLLKANGGSTRTTTPSFNPHACDNNVSSNANSIVNKSTEEVEPTPQLYMLNSTVTHGKQAEHLGKKTSTALPPEHLNKDGWVPALSDNGASRGANCTRLIRGRLPSTFVSNHEAVGTGDKTNSLSSEGTSLNLYKRQGSNGAVEVALRQMRYTPNLNVDIVFSEAAEVYDHGYTITFNAERGRYCITPEQELDLYMSPTKLGWYRTVPIDDKREQLKMLELLRGKPGHSLMILPASPITTEPSLLPLGDGDVNHQRATGMNDGHRRPLKGVAFLRREHARSHASLRQLIPSLIAAGHGPRFTKEDVDAFAREGCGICETTKMKRRSFTLRTIADKTVSLPGKRWIGDVLKLKGPSADHGFTAVCLFVDSCSKLQFEVGIRGETTRDLDLAQSQLRAFVRPVHGEVWIQKRDAHPSHKSVEMYERMAEESEENQVAPGGVHERVGDVEGAFMLGVPVANGFLLQSPDMDERHFHAAFRTRVQVYNHTATVGSDPVSSPIMRYLGTSDWQPLHTYVFGSPCKALVHPEYRDDKHSDHSYAGVYSGPAFHSRSILDCAIWDGRIYRDCDIGCVVIDERVCVNRCSRTHPCHQPFGQESGATKDPVVDLSKQYDPNRHMHPAATTDIETSISELPEHNTSPWYIGAPLPQFEFSIGLCSGRVRPGDVSSWLWFISNQRHMHIRIDLTVGGHEHNVERPEVLQDLLLLSSHDKCRSLFAQMKCGPFSAARFVQLEPSDPKPLFTQTHPRGVPLPDGTIPQAVTTALLHVSAATQLGRNVLSKNKGFLSEHPVLQARGSPYYSPGLEEHFDMHSTEEFVKLIQDFGLARVYTDSCMSDAPRRKALNLICDPVLAVPVRRDLGTLRCNHKSHGDTSKLGRGDDGRFLTEDTQEYTPLLSERFARCLHEYHRISTVPATDDVVSSPIVEGGAHQSSSMQSTQAATPPSSATESPLIPQTHIDAKSSESTHAEAAKLIEHPIGTRVEVYWHDDRVWYAGVLSDARMRSHEIRGKRQRVPEICVTYDDGHTLWHTRHGNTYRAEAPGKQQGSNIIGQHVRTQDGLTGDVIDKSESDSVAHLLIQTSPNSAATWHDLATVQHISSETEPMLASVMETRERDWSEAHKAYSTNSELKELWSSDEMWSDDNIIMVQDASFDLEDGKRLNKWSMFVIGENKKLIGIASASEIDTSDARHWHTPSNEREFNRSPQRALWQTAKELKWSQYVELNMFKWITVDQIDLRKHRIYNTMWAYKIKLRSDSTFDKLNPRWCVKGGSMDRDLYKAFAETMRMPTFKLILALKAGYYSMFCAFLIDCSNAFQTTRTDQTADGETPLPDFYVWPAPGFDRYTKEGKRMALQVFVGLQGRIDATRLFNQRLMEILEKAGCVRLLWDRQLICYHSGPHVKSDESLTTILNAIKGHKDSEPQSPPVGYAVIGWHVDDGTGLACDVNWESDPEKNRVVTYLRGVIAVTYATTLTGWHGNKALGFTLTCNDKEMTVSMSAPDALAQLQSLVLTTADLRYTPKHVLTDKHDEMPLGEVPPAGDPMRDATLARVQLTQKALGLSIWLSNAYSFTRPAINMLCSGMANPHELHLRYLRHTVAHWVGHPRPNTYGGWGVIGLETPASRVKPFTKGMKDMSYHFFSDASNKVRSMTGGVGMLAGGPIQDMSQRQQLTAPDSHMAEVVAAGNGAHAVIPVNGLLQELHIRLGVPTVFYLDSQTTVKVASDDAAAKKSVWVKRRIEVLHDAVTLDEISPEYIPESDMVADPFTKHLAVNVWLRHTHYLMNDDPGREFGHGGWK